MSPFESCTFQHELFVTSFFFTLWRHTNVDSGKPNRKSLMQILCLTANKLFFLISQKCNIPLLGYRFSTGEPHYHTHPLPPTLRHFSWPFPPVLPSMFTPERAGQTGWLTVNQKVFFCSVILSLQGGTPPSSAPNKTGFLYQPHSNSKVPKHYVKGAFYQLHPPIQPDRPPARPPARSSLSTRHVLDILRH